nr:MAG TPA: hypothetical protein [Caudoviricetes sp.]
MNKETKKFFVEQILAIADRSEFSRDEMIDAFGDCLKEFDRLAIIPRKRRCSRYEREHRG